MRRFLWLLAAALLVACGQEEEAPTAPAKTAPAVEPVDRSGDAPAKPKVVEPEKPEPKSTPAPEPEPKAEPAGEDGLFALRRYERLLNGQRAGTIEVRWYHVEYEGRRIVKDVTEFRSRTTRIMGTVRDSFTTSTRMETWREETGEMLLMASEVKEAGRISRSTIKRTADGYSFESTVGANRESFPIATAGPVQVDAETLLGPKIRAGEAKPGMTFKLPQLAVRRKGIVEHTLEIVGHDDEGPGLKVRETFEGHTSLWWFAPDGSVIRIRAGNSITRRDDSVQLDDLPKRAAAFRITLPSDTNLPRLFTGRAMVIDVKVRVDETVKPPQIPENPFTEVVKAGPNYVRLKLKSHDDPKATMTLPLPAADRETHAEYLKATTLMEVDHPRIKAAAKRIVGKETDARLAATKIADHVFQSLRKGSPALAQPTALEIHENPRGDCSEHALYFTALCRAAGIPARRCSGYVNIGSDWGSHAWCEIWLGKWIGADPTTNEIGTRARYIFLRRTDGPDGPSASIVANRTRIVTRRAEYVDGTIDFEKGKVDPVVLTGIRTAPKTKGWSVRHYSTRAIVTGPGLQARLHIQPDHGYFRHLAPGRGPAGPGVKFRSFGARPALVRNYGRGHVHLYVSLGREVLVVNVRSLNGKKVPLEKLAAYLAPTLERDA